MSKVIVAVATKRSPKLEAVSRALKDCASCFDAGVEFEIVGMETPSGVRHTPLTRDETMRGARQRAEALLAMARERGEPWQYFVGLEGGLDVMQIDGLRRVFLENWTYVMDAQGLSSYGQSGAILLPDELAHQVVDKRIELAEAIDTFTGRQGIRDREGAWGILTRGRIKREDAFWISAINAFAPLLNRALYGRNGSQV